jgi:hypothetical protein
MKCVTRSTGSSALNGIATCISTQTSVARVSRSGSHDQQSQADMNTIHNARITMFATLLNTMAGSSFTVGVAAPIAASFFYNPVGAHLTNVLGGVAFWLILAILLHIAAQRVLGGLRE